MICTKCDKDKTDDYFLKSNVICKTCLRKETLYNKVCNKCKNKKPTSIYTIDKRICDECLLLKNEEGRVCKKCQNYKNISRFRKDRNSNICYDCINIIRYEKIKTGKQKKYPNRNEKIKEWRLKNKHRLNEYRKKYSKNKYDNDINYKLSIVCRSFLRRCLYYKKNKRTNDILGYKADDLKKRLECQFVKGMDWSNYGKYWNIDHRKPISMFKEGTSIRTINALSNLKPVLCKINYSKQGKYIS